MQVAVEIERGEDAAGYAVAAAVIAAQLQTLAVQKPAQIDLPEQLLAVERVVEQRFRALAETRVRVGRAAQQELIGPGFGRRPVVEAQQTADFLAGDLRHQLHGPGLQALAPQDRPGGDPGNVVREQQIALEILIIDRALVREPLQHVEHQRAGRTDIAIQLDIADIALGRADDEDDLALVRSLEFSPDKGQDVAVLAIPGLQCLHHLVEPGARHGGADDIAIEPAQGCLVIDRDPFDLNAIHPHRRTRGRGFGGLDGRRGRRHDLGLLLRQHALRGRCDQRCHESSGRPRRRRLSLNFAGGSAQQYKQQNRRADRLPRTPLPSPIQGGA